MLSPFKISALGVPCGVVASACATGVQPFQTDHIIKKMSRMHQWMLSVANFFVFLPFSLLCRVTRTGGPGRVNVYFFVAPARLPVLHRGHNCH